MRILLLSFYYPPDIGPGPLRAKSLVDAMLEAAPAGTEIDVLTTVPNRYAALAGGAIEQEREGAVSIRRFRLPAHQSGFVDQSRAFGSFALDVLRETRGRRWDVVVATSSRLMTQVLAAQVARSSAARLYLDVRDLFTETIEQVLTQRVFRLTLPVFRLLERWTYRQVSGVNVVSPAFVPHVRALAPNVTPTVFTNGIDEEFLTTDFRTAASEAAPLVVYAGNIGDGQGLHRVLPDIAAALGDAVRFRLVGDGGRREVLERELQARSLRNVTVHAPVPRRELLAHYREARVLFLHLNDLPAFDKVLPSKIFEYAATGKPILAGVRGFAAEFLRREVPGAEVFEPCDAADMRRALERLLAGPAHIDRQMFCERFRRQTVMRGVATAILASAAMPTTKQGR